MVAPTGPLFLHHRISVGFHEKNGSNKVWKVPQNVWNNLE